MYCDLIYTFKSSVTTMEVSMVIVVLVLLLCVTVPVLIMASCLIYCLLSRQIKANEKMSSAPPTAISIIDSNTGETALTRQHMSVDMGYDNVLNTDDLSATAVFSFSRTPFGSRTTAAFGLGTSLKASWTTNGQSQGHDTLAAALEGVLALHKRLEDLRLQQTDDHNEKELEYNV